MPFYIFFYFCIRQLSLIPKQKLHTMKYRQINQLEASHEEQLEALFQYEWWTEGRKLTDIRKMLDNTTVVIALIDTTSDTLAGFVRIISDKVYTALISDVLIAKAYRGEGLGKQLVEAACNHPELAQVNRFDLYCKPDMENFYQSLGFEVIHPTILFMRNPHAKKGL